MKIGKYKITFNSPAVLGFGIISVLVMLVGYITKGVSNTAVFMTYRDSFLSPMMYIRLFTHVLGHSGWEHLLGNMAYILLLGPLLEEKYGTGKIVLIYLITALSTGIINNLFFPHTALCGASGICFAFILLSSVTSYKRNEIPLTFILVALIYIGQQVYEGLFLKDDISNTAHIVGGIVGATAGFLMNRKSLKQSDDISAVIEESANEVTNV